MTGRRWDGLADKVLTLRPQEALFQVHVASPGADTPEQLRTAERPWLAQVRWLVSALRPPCGCLFLSLAPPQDGNTPAP